jgi:hypothetical protein
MGCVWADCRIGVNVEGQPGGNSAKSWPKKEATVIQVDQLSAAVAAWLTGNINANPTGLTNADTVGLALMLPVNQAATAAKSWST